MAEDDRGRRAVAFIGEAHGVYENDVLVAEATLQGALHDAADQAAAGGYADKSLRVLSISFKATPNPHIKELQVIVTPEG